MIFFFAKLNSVDSRRDFDCHERMQVYCPLIIKKFFQLFFFTVGREVVVSLLMLFWVGYTRCCCSNTVYCFVSGYTAYEEGSYSPRLLKANDVEEVC